jgi:hypothetical protein
MVAISGALVLIAAAAAACRLVWVARISNKQHQQSAEFAEISQKPNKQDP